MLEKVSYMIAGLIIGWATTMVWMQPRLQVGPETVKLCREQLAALDAWSETDRARFWSEVKKDPDAAARWAVIQSIADLKIKKTPKKDEQLH